MVRGRPSGLKAACGTAARRPDGPDPGGHCGPWRQEAKGQAKACPPAARATRHL